ncbi:MAG TPA: FAD-dependent oxidoreductase [Ktedonobacteraceae bacterium]|nr:FAD-dependent oxidoreductase [Ktedonobacteraceae bacterium]
MTATSGLPENTIKRVERGDIVIVGNGIAGLTAAVEARRLAPDRDIVVITDQSHPTINTPALKQYAIGKLEREQLLAYPAGTERAQLIHVINARVEEIHAQEKYITMRGGRGLGYDALLIATGSGPTGLPANLPGRDFDGVLTLHRLPDYLDLRRRLSDVNEAVVIGGGAHAIETVMGLLYWGVRVHWLIRGETFLPKMLDQPASTMVLESIQRAGVMVYTGTEAAGIVGRVGAVAGVVTNRQQMLPCQLVLVCTGTSPISSLARHCDVPIQHKQGITVDDHLRTSARDIYAAGDVAAIQDPQTGQFAPRAQWYSAVQQGRIAAAAITDSPLNESFGVPWHATRLGELSMLTVGNVLQSNQAASTLTDNSRGSYRRMCVLDDRLVGYLSLGAVQPDSLAIKRIIDEGLSIRDIKKELLRGTFDARKYFSRKRTYAAQHMVTTGKLPRDLEPRPLTTRKLEAPPIAARAVSPASPARPAAFEQAATFAQGIPLARSLPSTGPLATPASVAANQARHTHDTGEDVQLFAIPFVPVAPDTIAVERQPVAERTRYSGQRGSRTAPVVESTLVRPPVSLTSPMSPAAPESPSVSTEPLMTPAGRGLKRQFKAPPTAKPKKRQSRQFSKLLERDSDAPEHYPSSSLWAYSDKVPVVKKGR